MIKFLLVNIILVDIIIIFMLYDFFTDYPYHTAIKTKPNGIIPQKGSAEAAGYDLYACIDEPVEIKPSETVMIGTGVFIAPPPGYFGAIFARSGLATKRGLRLANSVGVIDNDYTGEYICSIYNASSETQTINPNDRIAQLVFLPYLNVEFREVDELIETERSSGGFGHSGI